MLHLQIGFTSGRYWAASHADPSQPEWPPHPSRVYSALVAGAYGTAGHITSDERKVLQMLEAADPPAITFPDADIQSAANTYVPVNDEATRIASPGKSFGVLIPNRQARHFPVAFLTGEPEVFLSWSLKVTDDNLAVLDSIAARVTHIGTSHSLVTARFIQHDEPVSPRWIPGFDGRNYLRTPVSGRLDELDQQVSRHSAVTTQDALRRHAPLFEALTPYRPVSSASQPELQLDARHDWFALQLDHASWGADTAHTLARAARRALMALMGDGAPAALHGHDHAVEHLAWLPLPDVGYSHSRGRIRGLAVGFPRSLPAADAASMIRALQQLRQLCLPGGQIAGLSPVIAGASTPLVLRSETWCRASATWATVTPVILDHPPRRADEASLRAAMVQSLEHAGLPKPLEISLSRSSVFPGAPGAFDIPTRLPRYHAQVRFPCAVEGPVIAGRWRNFGVGLFRPVNDHTTDGAQV